MTEQPKVDPVATTVATSAAEVLAHHWAHDVRDLGAVMQGLEQPPGPAAQPPPRSG